MKNTIEQRLRAHFPQLSPSEISEDGFSAYRLLKHFGNYCAAHFESEKSKEILHKINALYQAKNIFDCNAIENEFLAEISKKLGIADFMNHLKIIPEPLWTVYIKVTLETHKNQKL